MKTYRQFFHGDASNNTDTVVMVLMIDHGAMLTMIRASDNVRIRKSVGNVRVTLKDTEFAKMMLALLRKKLQESGNIILPYPVCSRNLKCILLKYKFNLYGSPVPPCENRQFLYIETI